MQFDTGIPFVLEIIVADYFGVKFVGFAAVDPYK